MALETARVVEVWATGGGQTGLVGSGYLIAARSVLTAQHVIKPCLSDTSGVCQIRCMGQLTWVEAGVAWSDAQLDVALLQLSEPPGGGIVRAVRWGSVVGSQALDCTAVGFPEAQARADKVRNSEQIAGRIMPLTMAKTGQLAIQVRGSTPSPRSSGATAWHGMSGAAVFASNVLIGVVTDAASQWNEGRLIATPISQLADQASAVRAFRHAGVPLRLRSVPRPRYQDRLVALGAAALIAVAVALIATAVVVNASPPPIPGIGFKVGVIQLAVDPQSSPVAGPRTLTDVARDLSDAIAAQIRGDGLTVVGPQQLGRLGYPISSGSTQQERDAEALDRAQVLKADVMLYGTLLYDGNQTHLWLRFVVASQDSLVSSDDVSLGSLNEAADGTYASGELIESGDPTDSDQARIDLTNHAVTRAATVASIVRGMAEYNRGVRAAIDEQTADAVEDLERARKELTDAEHTLATDGSTGGASTSAASTELLAVINEFRATTYAAEIGQAPTVTCDVSDAPRSYAASPDQCARDNYWTALCLLGDPPPAVQPPAACRAGGHAAPGPDRSTVPPTLMARPHIGLGNVIFLPLASRKDINGNLLTPPCTAVRAAIDEYERAGQLAPPVDPLLIALKAQLNVGIVQAAWERHTQAKCDTLSAEELLEAVTTSAHALLAAPASPRIWESARDLGIRAALHLGWLDQDKALLQQRSSRVDAAQQLSAAHAHYQDGKAVALATPGRALLPFGLLGIAPGTLKGPNQIESEALRRFFWGIAVKQAESYCTWADIDPAMRQHARLEYRQAITGVEAVQAGDRSATEVTRARARDARDCLAGL